jgi:hypothetical protein
VTRTFDSALAIRARSLQPSLAAAVGVRMTVPSLKVSEYPSVSAKASVTGATPGYGTHDRFAMAGINAKVWPLSPGGWSSG